MDKSASNCHVFTWDLIPKTMLSKKWGLTFDPKSNFI